MRAMKDSGIEWIGEIPENWNRTFLINILRVKISDGPHETPDLVDEGIPFISVDSINQTKRVDLSVCKKYISEEFYEIYCKKTYIEKGDILFSKAATIGKTAIVEDEKFMVWSPLAIIKTDYKKANNQFLYYLLNCSNLIKYVSLLGSNNTQINVGMRELEKAMVPVPPIEEQERIAEFLDRKCGEIDEVIAKTEKTIEEYKVLKQSVITEAVTKGIRPNRPMKDSGIEWIGQIPEEWDRRKLKTLTDIVSKGATPKEINNEFTYTHTIRFLKSENIVDNKLSSTPLFTITSTINNGELKRSILCERDILFVIAGASIGKVAIIDKELLPANTNQAVCFIRIKEHFLSYINYIWYVLQSNLMKTYISLNSVQSAQPNISMEDIKDFYICLPPASEIYRIISYLDSKCIEIDKLIENKQQLLIELETYKKSMIYEYVTGKKEV